MFSVLTIQPNGWLYPQGEQTGPLMVVVPIPYRNRKLKGLSFLVEENREEYLAPDGRVLVERFPVVSIAINDEEPLYEGPIQPCGWDESLFGALANYHDLKHNEITIDRALGDGAELRINQVLPSAMYASRSKKRLVQERCPRFKILLRYDER